VVLTNVDFTNIEPGRYWPPSFDQDAAPKLANVTFESRGIIAKTPGYNTTTSRWVCEIEANATKAPGVCGKLTWTGGTVSGLNRDVTIKNVSTGVNDKMNYHGFMEVKFLQEVTITNVTFQDNVVPLITNGAINS
jgi:hypothetical protein